MKKTKFMALIMSVALVFGSCSTKTGTGALLGTGAGAILGAVVGKLAGNTAVGAAVGTAVGATAGTLIGKHMDKVKAQAEADLANATVQTVTDANGLQAVKITFDSGLLFASGKADLQTASKNELNNFANLLNRNTDCSVAIQGYTDNTPFRGKTAEQSVQLNQNLSQNRANSVSSYLMSRGVSGNQIVSVQGFGEANPVASNSTAAGKQQNRRVEVYMYASEAMINAANAGTLQ
ncbi:MAG: OmpA family protein [Prevotella sp.]|nr:OmpA family protein [Prevotella sp.]